MAKKSQHSIFTTIAFMVNVFFAVCLLISYASPMVSPDQYWVIAFFGLAYPFLLIINFIFIVFWMIHVKKQILLSLIVILIGYNYLNQTFQFSAKHLTDSENSIKLLSYNVRLFNAYQYNRDDKHRYEDRDKIFDIIKEEAPDIMCFQEFYQDHGHFKTIDTIVKFQDAKYFHLNGASDKASPQYYGVATFSRYPIVNKGIVMFNEKSENFCIFSDIVKAKDTIRIYNVHLESIRLSKEDEVFYAEISNQKEQEKLKLGTRKIMSKLKYSFIKRASQARSLAEHISHSPYPVIVCGDFNDTPTSYAYHIVSENLKDAFIESGKGIGTTYNGKFPSFRIDYMLYSSEFTAYDFEVKKVKYSDHYPILAWIVRR